MKISSLHNCEKMVLGYITATDPEVLGHLQDFDIHRFQLSAIANMVDAKDILEIERLMLLCSSFDGIQATAAQVVMCLARGASRSAECGKREISIQMSRVSLRN